jgi:hypothetical protein
VDASVPFGGMEMQLFGPNSNLEVARQDTVEEGAPIALHGGILGPGRYLVRVQSKENSEIIPIYRLSLAGRGIVQGELQVAPTLDLGAVPLGARRRIRLMASNRSQLPMLAWIASTNRTFGVEGTPRPIVLRPNEPRALALVEFRPTAVGRRSETVVVHSSDRLRSSVSITLRGEGVP